jgi:enoyl-CoA hydratase/carnithine racemase
MVVVLALRNVFETLPETVRAAVLDGEGDHFCAGLDLSELKERDAGQGLHHSRMWHAALECLQYGIRASHCRAAWRCGRRRSRTASACHIRVADESTFLRLARGFARHLRRRRWRGSHSGLRSAPRAMADMMLTGRGTTRRMASASVSRSTWCRRARPSTRRLELAQRWRRTHPLTNYALMHRPAPHRRAVRPTRGFLTEALMGGHCPRGAPEAKSRVKDFLEGRGKKVSQGPELANI